MQQKAVMWISVSVLQQAPPQVTCSVRLKWASSWLEVLRQTSELKAPGEKKRFEVGIKTSDGKEGVDLLRGGLNSERFTSWVDGDQTQMVQSDQQIHDPVF